MISILNYQIICQWNSEVNNALYHSHYYSNNVQNIWIVETHFCFYNIDKKYCVLCFYGLFKFGIFVNRSISLIIIFLRKCNSYMFVLKSVNTVQYSRRVCMNFIFWNIWINADDRIIYDHWILRFSFYILLLRTSIFEDCVSYRFALLFLYNLSIFHYCIFQTNTWK